MSLEPSAHTVETIAAISTPPGRGGIGIVRLSGPDAASIALGLVRLRSPLAHGRARLAELLDEQGGRIDEALVTLFAAPHSYTSEDVVEIAAHGSPVVLEMLLSRALEMGAALASPGEFTQRAFLSGRLDLTQAEAVRDLIEAQTLAQARAASSQLGGALSRRVLPVKQELLELLALLEGGIDFGEDDVAVAPAEEIARRIEALRPPLLALAASFGRGRLLHDGLSLAIIGRPNVGKSSLFNRLVERERAIVTAMPGTTRDTVSERISLDGIPLELVDTAGLREATDEVERMGIARSHEALADAALVVLVLEAGQEPTAEEQSLLQSLADRATVVVYNKSDLATPDEPMSPGWVGNESPVGPGSDSVATKPTQAGETVCDATVRLKAIRTSALTGEGIEELRSAIVALATGGMAAEPGMLTSLRQKTAVDSALAALADSAQANQSQTPHEMILLDLYRALWALDSLTGQTTPDDVLNRIFSTFCIGK